MKGKLKAALFDLDGVVFDTEPQYTKFWGDQCREFHPEHPGLEQEIKGQTLQQIYDRYFSGSLLFKQKLITERLNAFERDMELNFVAGFEAFVANLRAQGVKTAVVTSSNKQKMEAVYSRHTHFKDMFDAILTAEDFDKSKPDPDCYLKAAARFHALPSECVVLEDSFNGLKSGRAANMFVVGLATTNPTEALVSLANVVVGDYVGFDLFGAFADGDR